jgi:mannose-6-phosphate isomerase-like protein (cupin superfamily)
VSGAGTPLTALRLPAGVPVTVETVADYLRELGVTPGAWSNGPGDRYAPHAHPTTKLLVCAAGSITFQLDHGSVTLAPGEGFVLPPGTRHAAVVGPSGVTCVEGHRG